MRDVAADRPGAAAPRDGLLTSSSVAAIAAGATAGIAWAAILLLAPLLFPGPAASQGPGGAFLILGTILIGGAPLWIPIVGGIGGGLASRRRGAVVGSAAGTVAVMLAAWGVTSSSPDRWSPGPVLITVAYVSVLAAAAHLTTVALRGASGSA